MKIDININMLSDEYRVHKLTEEDIEDVLNLCIKNTMYYEYCPPLVTKEEIREDMTSLPKGQGIFAEALISRGYKVIDSEDIK